MPKTQTASTFPRTARKTGLPEQQGKAGSPLRGKCCSELGPTFQRFKELESHHVKLNYTLGLQAPHEYFFPLPACCSQGSSTKPRPLVACGKQAHIASFPLTRDTTWITQYLKALLTVGTLAPKELSLSPQFPSMAKNG